MCDECDILVSVDVIELKAEIIGRIKQEKIHIITAYNRLPVFNFFPFLCIFEPVNYKNVIY